MNYNDDRHIDNGMRHAGLVPSKSERNEAKLQDRIAELEKERDQWQESSGQNYVRAQDAEFREERACFERDNALRRIAVALTCEDAREMVEALEDK